MIIYYIRITLLDINICIYRVHPPKTDSLQERKNLYKCKDNEFIKIYFIQIFSFPELWIHFLVDSVYGFVFVCKLMTDSTFKYLIKSVIIFQTAFYILLTTI